MIFFTYAIIKDFLFKDKNIAYFYYNKSKVENYLRYYRQGKILQEKNRHTEAVFCFEKAKQYKNTDMVNWRLFKSYRQKGDIDLAKSYVRTANLLSNNSKIEWLKAEENFINKYGTLDDIKNIGKLNNISKNPYYEQVCNLYKNKHYGQIAYIFNDISLENLQKDEFINLSQIYVDSLFLLQNLDKIREFVGNIDISIFSNKKFIYQLAIAFLNTEKQDYYLNLACKAYNINNDKLSLFNLFRLNGDWLKAKNIIEQNFYNTSSLPPIDLYNISVVYDRNYEYKKAISFWDNNLNLILSLNDNNIFHIAMQYEMAGLYDKAIFHYNLIKDKNLFDLSLYRIGYCCYKLNNFKQAVSYFLHYFNIKQNIKNLSLIDNSLKLKLKMELISKGYEPKLSLQIALIDINLHNYEEACLSFIQSEFVWTPDFKTFNLDKISNTNKQNILYRQLLTLPIEQNWIMYESFMGRTISCSPLAMYLYYKSKYPNFIHIWSVTNKDIIPKYILEDKKTIIVTRNSNGYIRALALSKFLISNVTFPSFFFKREEQIYCNTWHGIPIKTLGKFNVDLCNLAFANVRSNFMQADFIFSPTIDYLNLIKDSHILGDNKDECFLYCKYPRMLTPELKPIDEQLNIDFNKITVLYAPTWRNLNSINKQIDYFKERYFFIRRHTPKDWNVIFKGHHFVEDSFIFNRNIKIAPKNIDTNVLLSKCDIVISDYSSIIYDAIDYNLKTICLVDDYDKYQRERGLYLTLDQMPGIVCKNLEDLENELTKLSKATLSKCKNVQDLLSVKEKQSIYQSLDKIISFQNTNKKVNNKHKKVLIYGGKLYRNGILTAFFGFLEQIKENPNLDIYIVVDTAICKDESNRDLLHFIASKYKLIPFTRGINFNGDETWVYNKLQRNSVSTNKFKSLKDVFVLEYHKHFNNDNFDMIINFEGYDMFWCLLCAFAPVKERAIVLHSDMQREAKTRFNYLYAIFQSYPLYTKVISVSKETMVNNLPLIIEESENKVEALFINNILPKEPFIQKSEEYSKQNEIKALIDNIKQSGKKVILSIGRLSQEKNQLNLVKAFNSKDILNQAVLLFAGNGPLFDVINKEINSLHLNNSVFLLGFVENIPELLKDIDLFVNISNYEGQPMVVLEALEQGKKCLLSKINAHKMFIEAFNLTSCDVDSNSIKEGIIKALSYEHDQNIIIKKYEYYKKFSGLAVNSLIFDNISYTQNQFIMNYWYLAYLKDNPIEYTNFDKEIFVSFISSLHEFKNINNFPILLGLITKFLSPLNNEEIRYFLEKFDKETLK